MPPAHPRLTRQIAARRHRLEAGRAQQFANRLGLIETVLQQQPATGMQARWRSSHQLANIRQTVSSRGQRLAGLKAQVTP